MPFLQYDLLYRTNKNIGCLKFTWWFGSSIKENFFRQMFSSCLITALLIYYILGFGASKYFV